MIDKDKYILNIIRAADYFGCQRGVFIERKDVEDYVETLDLEALGSLEAKELKPNKVAIRLLDEKAERLRKRSRSDNRGKCKDVNIATRPI